MTMKIGGFCQRCLNDLETELENYDRQVAGQRYKNLWNEQGEKIALRCILQMFIMSCLYLSNLVKRACVKMKGRCHGASCFSQWW